MFAAAALTGTIILAGCAGVTPLEGLEESAVLPDSGMAYLGGKDGSMAPAPDSFAALDTVKVASGCALSPHGLHRFPTARRRTTSGRVFSGWGGSPSGGKPLRPPLVLIPGNSETANRWLDLRKQLCALGYSDQEVWAITFKQPSCVGLCLGGSNSQHASELELFVKLVKAETGASKVNLVAVSMGVTTARYYLKFRGGLTRDEVGLAYLISGPNHGTPMCDMPGAAAMNVACAEIATHTQVQGWLHDLNQPDETPNGQGDGVPASREVTYRTVSYALDPAFPGLYIGSPQLKGADNLRLAGAKHGVVPFKDFWGYLKKVK